MLEGDQVVPLDRLVYDDRLHRGRPISRGPIRRGVGHRRQRAGASLAPLSYADLDVPPAAGRDHLISPIAAPEIWACGVTYRRSADFREGDMQTGKGIYDMVYDAARPEVFSKGGDSRCVGPNAAATIRTDSAITVPEAELAYVLGANGEIVGYTICDDVSAWDIERANPLYLPQSKDFLRLYRARAGARDERRADRPVQLGGALCDRAGGAGHLRRVGRDRPDQAAFR